MEELHKIQNKARLLYEMLDNLKEGDTIDETSTMEELKGSCESALPKIRNMLKEEEDDEKIELLNEVKSVIKGVILKYQDIKHGHYDTQYDVSGKFKSSEMDTSASNLPPQAISLIDLDDMNENNSSSSDLSPNNNNTTTSKNAMEELSDIFGDKTNISNTSRPSSADPFDLLSQSITSNTLPPSSPKVSKINTSSSPIAISSPSGGDDDNKVERTSK